MLTRKVCLFLVLLLLFPIVLSLEAFPKENRGLNMVKVGEESESLWGDYHAFIIGINDYQEWPQLRTAVKDAESLRDVLLKRYKFPEDQVILKVDKEATRRAIIRDLRHLASNLTKKDNLLIYFAGHGQLDDLTGDGFWVPVEGKLKAPDTWISHSNIKNILSSENVKAKNIVVVADSCYSGMLLRGGPSLLSVDDKRYQSKLKEMASRRSRQVITSGGLEPVADGGRDGHSLFAYYFLKALEENSRKAIDLENLFHTYVWKPVTDIGGQRPNVGRLKTPMDEDGQFVLVIKIEIAVPPKKADQSEQPNESSQLEQERRELERLKLENERKRLENERAKLEGEKARLTKFYDLQMPPDLERFTNSIGMEFVLIPAGTFVMGGNLSPGQRWYENETPRHKITITKPFYLQTTEVTQGQWIKVMVNNPSEFVQCGKNCPVDNVSWNMAQEFIKKLNEMEKTQKYRLPTEAEWEYACRAGSKTRFCFGDDEDQLKDYAWYEENSGDRTHPVAQKRPNLWGLYDVHGNVWEWCQDYYHVGYWGRYFRKTVKDSKGNWLFEVDDYERSNQDPKGPPDGVTRVLRGGSSLRNYYEVRSAIRFGYKPDTQSAWSSILGFRVARDH